jgi:hypothetical protein
MKLVMLLKPGLFIYEVFKILIFAILLIMEANNPSIFLLAFFAAQGAIFPIMALFLCLDAVRYKEYLPLFIAGKGIGIFILLGWSLFSQQGTMIAGFFNGMTFLSFDLFALAAILFIKKETSDLTEAPNEPGIMEEK